MITIPTPHIAASKEDIAKTLLMPGDPLRSRWIAENFLENPRLVNNIRGVQGYTGTWNGNKVTVMASGIGIPAMSLYSYELFRFYDIDSIIRVGTCGSIQQDVNIGDVLIADRAYTDSDFLKHLAMPVDFIPGADGELLKNASFAAEECFKKSSGNHKFSVGPVLTQELYYNSEDGLIEKWSAAGVQAFEMETAALYANALAANKRALAVFTVSNSILTGEEMDPALRERSLNQMVEIALKAAFR